jgi:hypothetical protein
LTELPPRVCEWFKKKSSLDLEGATTVCEAYAKISKPVCNYFTHFWAMEDMTSNCEAVVGSGIFAPDNLRLSTIGDATTVDQKMIYRDGKFSGEYDANTAAFGLLDPNKVAQGWFVSIYDPGENDGRGFCRHAIVVKWTLIPEGVKHPILPLWDTNPFVPTTWF